ncbi:M50 family metallopeptidase [Paenibacillus yanchengensis]|uniref:M50 family metallopeptidase n=1 Tax=Paenibacillus yanchengensis TaxID=2035833 RepID=A0ABW4YQF6_9BACL
MYAWLKMAAVLIVTAMLTRLTPFSFFFRNVDTLIHELSHALVTLVLSGKVRYIYLFSDQSGVTLTSFASAWKGIPISLAGYTGSAMFAVLLFFLFAHRKVKAGLIVIASLALIGLLLFVRNNYGMMWSGGFVAVTILVYAFAPSWLRNGYYLLIAFICLVESVLSSFTILSMSFLYPSIAGDATNLSNYTHVPAFVWGILFTLFSLWCAKHSTMLLFRKEPEPIDESLGM